MVRTKKGFRGKQQNLYTLARKAWGYCLDNITDINKAKKLYTPSFIADQVAKVDTAEAIPDFYARKELTVEAHQKMKAAALAVTDKWQFLKDYIPDAYDKSLVKSKLESAGQSYYEGATYSNWDSVASLINSAKLFMTANAATLEANDNMPKEFPTAFEALATAFTNLRNTYFGKEDDRNDLTSDKEAADDAILDTLMPMLKLAQRVYKDDPDKLALFVYANLLRQVRGNHPSGLKGFVRADGTKQPLVGANFKAVSMGEEEATTYTATSGEDGRYELVMASGVYMVEVSVPGYQTLLIEKRKIDVGVKHRLNLAMEAELMPSDLTIKGMLDDMVAAPAPETQPKSNGTLALV